MDRKDFYEMASAMALLGLCANSSAVSVAPGMVLNMQGNDGAALANSAEALASKLTDKVFEKQPT